jgi:hypothetical protein
MTPDEARLLVLEHRIGQNVPDFEVRFKNRNRKQKILGALMFWNRRYMTDYISTFYPYVYWTAEKEYRSSPLRSFKVLAHEYVHLLDHKRHPFWFGFSYLLPHLIALLSVVAVVAAFHSPWWLCALASFIAAAPLPSPWRRNWEMRGYTMSMAINAWKHGNVNPSTVEWIVEQFTGWSYYRMWPYEKGMRKRLQTALTRIHSGDVLLTSEAFKQVKDIVDSGDADVVEEAKRIAHARRVNGEFPV